MSMKKAANIPYSFLFNSRNILLTPYRYMGYNSITSLLHGSFARMSALTDLYESIVPRLLHTFNWNISMDGFYYIVLFTLTLVTDIFCGF